MDRCADCGETYRHLQHPMKPLGVIAMSVCACEYVTSTVGGVTTITKRAPARKEVPMPLDPGTPDRIQSIAALLESVAAGKGARRVVRVSPRRAMS